MFNYLSEKKRLFVLFVFALVFAIAPAWAADMQGGEKGYPHLVVIADPHLPGKGVSAKEAVIGNISSWEDVNGVAVLGDICYEFGLASEYEFAKGFFAKLTKPAYFITGNHDYYYDDFRDRNGNFTKAFSGNQEKKLKVFRETFNQAELYYSRKMGVYLLVFLSLDELGSSDLARISGRQIDWLRSQLAENRSLPTIIFCHAPLKGTLQNYNKYANTPNFVIQPESVIRELILQNPQVLLWVSGHTHTCPPNTRSYASEINLYEKRVMNIHNCDMNHSGTFWTNSLFLYSDRVVVKTFDHTRKAWIDNLQRSIAIPPGSNEEDKKTPEPKG